MWLFLNYLDQMGSFFFSGLLVIIGEVEVRRSGGQLEHGVCTCAVLNGVISNGGYHVNQQGWRWVRGKSKREAEEKEA